jgi:DNA modification methylase
VTSTRLRPFLQRPCWAYLRGCKTVGVKGHPARFPSKLPEFFIKYLSEPGDLVVDIFAGSNTTGQAAEALGRRWLAYDLIREYLAPSALRFLDNDSTENQVNAVYAEIIAGRFVDLLPKQPSLPVDAAE